jgi:hypothetical protein
VEWTLPLLDDEKQICSILSFHKFTSENLQSILKVVFDEIFKKYNNTFKNG